MIKRLSRFHLRWRSVRTGLFLGAVALLILGLPTVIVTLLHPRSTEAAWFDSSWGFRKRIPVANSSGSTQTAFQFQFTIATDTLVSTSKLQTNCNDVRITDQSGKTLPFWIEPTTCNTNATKIWVKIPSIPTTGANIYFYYGNPSALAATYKTTDVFIREITGVLGAWNMDEASWNGTAGEVIDTSGNANNGTGACVVVSCTKPTTAAAKFGNGGSFDGNTNKKYLDMGTSSVLKPTSSISVGAWVKTSATGAYTGIVERLDNGSLYKGYTLGYDGISTFFHTGGTYAANWLKGTRTINDGNWHHIVGTYDGTTNTIYVDGTVDSSAAKINNLEGGAISMRIATDYALSDGRFFNGLIDDVRVYSRALTGSEVTVLYSSGGNNQGYTTTNYPGKELVRKYNTGVTIGTVAAEETGQDPLAYWKFDEGTGITAKDSTTNGKNGTLLGTVLPTWQTGDQCINGQCLFFDGATSRVTAAMPAFPTNYTVSVWVRPTNTFAKGCTGGHSCMTIFNQNPFYFALDSTGKPEWWSGSAWVQANTAVSLNKWTQLTFVASSNGTVISFYINGVLDKTTSASAISVSAGTFYIGVRSDSINSSYTFQGYLDEPKFYSYARTTAQVQADALIGAGSVGGGASMGAPLPNLSQGLIGYWKMNETSGNAIDASGNGRTGTWAGTGANHYTAGKYGNAGGFNGTDDYVTAGNLGTTPTQGTISFWVTTAASASYPNALSTNREGGNSAFRFEQSGTNFYSYDGANQNFLTTAMALNTWYHVVFTWDSTKNNETTYLNGVKTSSSNCLRPTTITDFGIGAGFSSGRRWNGKIDEVRLYNRALPADEVRQLYNFAPAPVGWWKLDEKQGGTANDNSGNGNNGSWTGTGNPRWVTGQYGGAGQFNGSNDYIDAGTGTSLNITGTQITYEAWVKVNETLASTQFRSILIRHTAWNGLWYVNGTGNSLTCANKFLFGLNGTWLACSTTTPTVGTWYHLVGTYDGANIRLYVNGQLETTAAYTTAIATTAGASQLIGKRSDGFFFKGQLDDLKIYNYARTQQQVVEDMNGGHPAPGSPVGSQVGYWKFDEGQGTIANNSGNGGNSLNGNLSGFATPATATSGWQLSNCKTNKCLAFNGSSNSVSLGTSAGLSPAAITVTAWIKTSATGTQVVVRNRTNGYGLNLGAWSGVGGTAHKATFWIYSGGFKVATGTTSVDDGQWHYLQGTYDGSTVKIYVDGKQEGSLAFSGSITYGGAGTYIGADVGGDGLYFNGLIDEVKIYNSALALDQIRQDYNAGAAVNFGSTAASESAQLVDGPGAPPVAYWNFEEGKNGTVNDVSGGNNVGSWQGTGTAHWKPGKFGKAGNFNGSDDYVNTTDLSYFSFVNNPLTIEVWAKVPINTPAIGSGGCTGNGAYMIGKGGSSNWEWTLENDNNNLICFAANDLAGSLIHASASVARTVNDGQWHHYTGVITDNVNISLYIDGVLVSNSTTFTSTGGDGTATVKIGTRQSGSNFFTGQIDEVKIYSYARTPAQIAYDYNRGAPVAWYKMDECQGTVIHDSSGSGLDGTWGGGTAAGTCNTASTAWGNGLTGKFNSSLSFNGINSDYFNVSNSALFNFYGGASFTLSAWVKRQINSSIGPIVEHGTGSVGGYVMGVGEAPCTTNQIKVTKYGVVDICIGSFPADTNWHHLVEVGSPSGVNVYIDGVLSGTSSNTQSWLTSSDALQIGGHTTLTANYFTGQIDDVRIFNYALSTTQIKKLYDNNSSVFYGPATGIPQ